MRLTRAYAVNWAGDRAGVNHAAWFDGEMYTVVCGTTFSGHGGFDEVLFKELEPGMFIRPLCRRCQRVKLARHRAVRRRI